MLIVGCGYVGRRLARDQLSERQPIVALVRTPESLSELEPQGISAVLCDLDSAVAAGSFSTAGEDLFYLAPPPSAGTDDPRMARFLATLDASKPPRRVVLVSTTAVYGSTKGDWVDETSLVEPLSARGQRRWDAEKQLIQWCDAAGCEWVVLRVSGIYGPQRLPLERLQRAVPMVSEADAPWTNRIHVDDLVSVLKAAMQQDCANEIFNVSDGAPGNMRQYFDQIADLAHLPRAPEISMARAREELSPGMLSYLSESRRIDNRKLIKQLAITLRYPDLASGVRQSLDEQG